MRAELGTRLGFWMAVYDIHYLLFETALCLCLLAVKFLHFDVRHCPTINRNSVFGTLNSMPICRGIVQICPVQLIVHLFACHTEIRSITGTITGTGTGAETETETQSVAVTLKTQLCMEIKIG